LTETQRKLFRRPARGRALWRSINMLAIARTKAPAAPDHRLEVTPLTILTTLTLIITNHH
jgi:hypothetical protein